MQSSRVPIDRLLVYINERVNLPYNNFLQLFNEYYEMLFKQKYEETANDFFFYDQCECAYGTINTIPDNYGIILFAKEGRDRLGITTFDTKKVFVIDHGILSVINFDPSQWLYWGAMLHSFKYDSLSAAEHMEFGTRDLHEGMSGRDIRILQLMLQRMNYKTGTIGYFDAVLTKCIKYMQEQLGLPQTGVIAIDTSNPDNKRLLDFIKS